MTHSKISRQRKIEARETGAWDSKRPPLHIGKQAPYENDRRAGKTHPDRVEIISDTDPRSFNFVSFGHIGRKPTRAQIRSRGVKTGSSATTRSSSRRRSARAS